MEPQPSSPITTESARKPKGFKIATIILSILVLGLSGLSVFLFINNSQTDSSTSEDKDSSQNATATEIANSKTYLEELAVREVVESIKKVTDNFMEGPYFINSYGYVFPVYQPANAKTAIKLNNSYGLYFLANPTNEELNRKLMSTELEDLVKTTFSDLGFSLYKVTTSFSVQYLNSTTNIICSYSERTNPFSLECGNTSWITNSDIDLINTLAEPFRSSQGEYPSFISANASDIKDSTYAPYQTITVGLDNAAGLFYRTSPESDWVFFTGTQAQIPCSDFNSTDLKRAFAGTACYDEADNSATVQP